MDEPASAPSRPRAPASSSASSPRTRRSWSRWAGAWRSPCAPAARCSPSATAAPPRTPSTSRPSWSAASPSSGAAWPAIALTTDTSILTAVANDYGFDAVFRRQVEAHGKPGDVAVGISTSGRSPNVMRPCGARETRPGHGRPDRRRRRPAGGARCTTSSTCPITATPRIQEVHGRRRPRPLPVDRGGDRRLMARLIGEGAARPALGASRWTSPACARMRCADRKSKVTLSEFARPHAAGRGCRVSSRGSAHPGRLSSCAAGRATSCARASAAGRSSGGWARTSSRSGCRR